MDKKILGNRVITGAELLSGSEKISQIIELLPEEGILLITRTDRSWQLECRIGHRQILKKNASDPDKYLEYIRSLLEVLKGLENER